MEPAKFHCNDTGPKGTTGHNSSDGTSMGGRLGRFGQFSGHCGENISYGQATPLAVIIQLIVDDGVPSRGHRTNLFNPNFKVCGTFSGPHKAYGHMSTQNFATGYTGNGQKSATVAKPAAQKRAPSPVKKAGETQQPTKHFENTKQPPIAELKPGMSMQEQLQIFMKAPVTFPGEPTDFSCYSTSVNCSCDGVKMSKTATKTFTLRSGGSKAITVTV